MSSAQPSDDISSEQKEMEQDEIVVETSKIDNLDDDGSSVKHRAAPQSVSHDTATSADDSGDETPDTDKEDEEHRVREDNAKNKGIRPLHRASFKRHRTDRYYDK